MPGGYWAISNRGLAGSAATATQSFPAAALVGNQQLRLRALQVTMSGPGAGTDRVVVRDGASGVGDIIWSADLSVQADGFASIFASPLDLRASVGNSLTIEFAAGVASDREDVNAQGDLVSEGYPVGGP